MRIYSSALQMMNPKHHRSERVGPLVRSALQRAIQEDLRDPRLGFTTITRVHLSPDLRHATIMVSILADADTRQASMAVLQGAASYLRRLLASRLKLRNTPSRSFREDPGIRAADRIDGILRDLQDPVP